MTTHAVFMGLATFITNFGDLAVTLPIAAVVFVFLVQTPNSRRLAVGWAIAVGFCGVTLGLLKIYFSTRSTSLVDSPSGHVGMSTLVFGGLALMAASRWRWLAVPPVSSVAAYRRAG